VFAACHVDALLLDQSPTACVRRDVLAEESPSKLSERVLRFIDPLMTEFVPGPEVILIGTEQALRRHD
jgi:hypothetical protein